MIYCIGSRCRRVGVLNRKVSSQSDVEVTFQSCICKYTIIYTNLVPRLLA